QIAANDPNNGIERGTGDSTAARAATTMDLARRQAEQKFESSPEWVEATTALTDAKAANERERSRVIAALANEASYQAAKNACVNAKNPLTAGRAGARAPDPRKLVGAVADARHGGTAVSQMKSTACGSDPAATAAAARLKDANNTMAQLRRQEQAAVTADPAW